MEFQINGRGHRVYPSSFKRELLEQLKSGAATASELSRKYQIPIQNLVKWRRREVERVEGMIRREAKAQGKDESELISAYRKINQENEKLRRSLANMTVERDILKDAVDIAAKKKWL